MWVVYQAAFMSFNKTFRNGIGIVLLKPRIALPCIALHCLALPITCVSQALPCLPLINYGLMESLNHFNLITLPSPLLSSTPRFTNHYSYLTISIYTMSKKTWILVFWAHFEGVKVVGNRPTLNFFLPTGFFLDLIHVIHRQSLFSTTQNTDTSPEQ